ncbi:MAG: NAD(P)-binding protein [Chloroflexi bacterium]|nr:NAD(P)-binding protein [Chloroflexota bacterium]MCL5107839.1 NAD(P)-binding protein [Chloroflexota bacterium]
MTIERTPHEVAPISVLNLHGARPRVSYWTQLRPVYRNHVSPCTNGCPAGEQIATYMTFTSLGRYREAWETILQDNPLPGVCGRVCYHPCEPVCNRGSYDEPLAIHAIERHSADHAASLGLVPEPIAPRFPERVAVIGAGPAGLSAAYHLAEAGYRATVYEMHNSLGGMLRLGIPAYRLPREVIDREVDYIAGLGVEFRLGQAVGRDFAVDDLFGEGYGAVYLATGAHKAKRLGVPGEDLPGVRSGLNFLAEVNAGRREALSGRVAIIGGGNTAMDVCRSALRAGARATVVYRRTRAEMPAIKEEIEEAEREGVEFVYLAAPKRIVRGDGGRLDLVCDKMRLGEGDPSGRRSVTKVAGGEFALSFDSILLAIGEDPDLSFLPADVGASERQIVVDRWGNTSRTGVFAGGDAASQSRRVVDAIGDGKRAAVAIHRHLRGEQSSELSLPKRIIPVGEIDLTQFAKAARVPITSLPEEEAVHGFAEVNLTLTQAEAKQESDRCFSCGVCTYCDRCMVYCPDLAIAKVADDRAGYAVNLDWCKGCRLCVDFCPREAMEMEGSPE